MEKSSQIFVKDIGDIETEKLLNRLKSKNKLSDTDLLELGADLNRRMMKRVKRHEGCS